MKERRKGEEKKSEGNEKGEREKEKYKGETNQDGKGEKKTKERSIFS